MAQSSSDEVTEEPQQWRLKQLVTKVRAAIDEHNCGRVQHNPITALRSWEVDELAGIADRKRKALGNRLIEKLGAELGCRLFSAVFDDGRYEEFSEGLLALLCDRTARKILALDRLVREARAIMPELDAVREAALARWIEEERPRRLESRDVVALLRKRGMAVAGKTFREVFGAAIKARIITDLEYALAYERHRNGRSTNE